MTIKRIVIAAMAFGALSMSTYALAAPLANPTQDQDPFTQGAQYWPAKTIYLEANIGSNLAYFAFVSDGYKSGGWGWSGAVGYNFTDFFALEGGFMQNYGFDAQSDEDDDVYVRAHTNVPYAATRFTLPIDKFAFIGKLGIMDPNISGSTTENGKTYHATTDHLSMPFIGIGAGYSLSKHVQLVAQYQGALYGFMGFGLASLGVDYRF